MRAIKIASSLKRMAVHIAIAQDSRTPRCIREASQLLADDIAQKLMEAGAAPFVAVQK